MRILRWIITFQITTPPNTPIPKAVKMYVEIIVISRNIIPALN